MIELLSFEKYISNLSQIFGCFEQYGLSTKLSKCNFFKKKLIYLEHEISAKEIRSNTKKTEAIIKMQPLTNIAVCGDFWA
jgi:hypothetical protein